MDFFVRHAWLVPALPLLGALVAAIGGKWLREKSHLPVIAGIGLAFLVSLGLLTQASPEAMSTPIRWLTISGLEIPIEFQVDGLTTMMLAMVTFVATLVAVFAAGYMAGDPGFPRFFAIVGLFVTAMTGLVLSANYLLTYVFWEGVGVCSYLLVGFWHDRPAAALAAKKAFLVNRIGDVGFAIAIFWMWSAAIGHDLSYANVLSADNLHYMPTVAVGGIALLLFWAASAKSAQIPLYVWLPDAMEGPTPVSALIHAATMVTAGVYLVARSTPLLVQVPEVQLVVAIIGCLTALLAAAIAVTQTDLKRVLAYSTVSQLGYMFMALGSGVKGVAAFAVIAGMFHLFTHAFFKALLFLCSGSVMHAMGGVIDMRQFGGLRKRLPVTYYTFAVGALALSGIPIFAGFFSKDEILTAIRTAAHLSNDSGGTGWGWVYYLIYATALGTAGLTAFYTGRAFFLTFHGAEKLPDWAVDSHDGQDHAQDHGHDAHFGHEGGGAGDDRAADRPGPLRRAGRADFRADRLVRASPGANPRTPRGGALDRARVRLADGDPGNAGRTSRAWSQLCFLRQRRPRQPDPWSAGGVAPAALPGVGREVRDRRALRRRAGLADSVSRPRGRLFRQIFGRWAGSVRGVCTAEPGTECSRPHPEWPGAVLRRRDRA